eukprot:CAMPEP_0184291604 /NCGR_PEP_ID=MMETSP1049-20130417/3577_1 /TAXON_ID=77928 /ORGANISM="Proteomonas sulcata, Strain CCMP704" /LENGTH=174 /DNA_ID=CAMNT_0026599093 /DNA_START=173 /DNA_END=697 /DNA_ORIENTATION=-
MRASVVLAAVCLLAAAAEARSSKKSGNFGYLGQVDDSEAELRHTVGTIGRTDPSYYSAEKMRNQAKELENGAKKMEHILEKRLASSMDKEEKEGVVTKPVDVFAKEKQDLKARKKQKKQLGQQLSKKAGSPKVESASAARKAAVQKGKAIQEKAKKAKKSSDSQSTSWFNFLQW